jgi:hypothetical protein
MVIFSGRIFDLKKFLAGVSKTIAAVAVATAFRVLTDEDNIVNRSAMDALRYSKK